MSKEIIAIDFGSAFTKVSFRPSQNCEGDVARLRDGLSVPELAVPSVVVIDRSGSDQPQYLFGQRAYDKQPGAGEVLRENWKRSLFSLPTDLAPQPRGWDALLSSPEFAELATRYQLTRPDTEGLHRLVQHVRQFVGVPPQPPVAVTTASDRTELLQLATEYFKWLLGLVVAHVSANSKPKIKKPSAIPVRVTVPAFVAQGELQDHPGCLLLREAITAAGWTLDAQLPFVSEPLANVVGLVTRGVNVFAKGRAELPSMLRRSPLAPAIKQEANVDPAVVYRMIAIDVGAYTTDVGLIGCDPHQYEESHSRLEKMYCYPASEPVGILELRADVFTASQPDVNFDPDEASSQERDQYFRNRLDEAAPRVAKVVKTFAERVAEVAVRRTREFIARADSKCRSVPHRRELRYDLAITGGGSYIPAVVAAVRDALAAAGLTFINTYLPCPPPPARQEERPDTASDRRQSAHTHHLTETLIRGGTAIGGASVFFG